MCVYFLYYKKKEKSHAYLYYLFDYYQPTHTSVEVPSTSSSSSDKQNTRSVAPRSLFHLKDSGPSKSTNEQFDLEFDDDPDDLTAYESLFGTSDFLQIPPTAKPVVQVDGRTASLAKLMLGKQKVG